MLVTGSTSGIGKEIARTLAKAGCRLIVHGFDDVDVGKELREEMLSAGAKEVHHINMDLLEDEAPQKLIAEVHSRFGSIDILVNNAGIQHVAPITELPNHMWKQIIELNLSVPFFLIKETIENMRENNWGRIINISSVHGLVASQDKSAYVSAKHGLIGLTKTVALETAEDAITCNAICPGYVQAGLAETQLAAYASKENISIEQAEKQFLSLKQPSGRFVKPSAIGELVSFLCSEAGDQITGSSFTLDGGWSAQ